MKKASRVNLKDAFAFDGFDRADVAAIQAVGAGVADAAQQKRALQVILYKVCGFDDVSFRPGAPDITAFLEGQRFVAQKIQMLLQYSPQNFKEDYE